jgi:acyl carrier protein phosphodiesterase
MNFLAHALLSGQDGDILLGNLMADFLKPGTPMPDCDGVRRGIEWHYEIDRFMDSHPLVARSRARLFGQHRHYSAVLVDLFYDHLLATNWSNFSQQPLERFAFDVYQQLHARQEMMPPRMREVVPAMIEGDWLVSYGKPEGICYALSRVQRRASRGDGLMRSWNEFLEEKPLYEAEFFEFMPQIMELDARRQKV